MPINKCTDCGEILGVEKHVCKKKPPVTVSKKRAVEYGLDIQGLGPNPSSNTYKYRDPVKRREQVKLAMRKYRARKKEGSTWK